MTWSLTAGALPAGLTLGSNGVISVTPSAAGSFAFTVRVASGSSSTSKQLQLVVREKLTASAPAAQTWEVGRPLQVTLSAKGGAPGYSWKLSGTLPAKTGFIGGVRSLSGYVQNDDGHYIVFSIIFNGIRGSVKPVEELQDNACRVLAAWPKKIELPATKPATTTASSEP